MVSMAFAQVIPDFQLKTLQKKTISLHSVLTRSHYTVLSLVSLSCGYCMLEMRDFEELSEKFSSRNVTFVAIFSEENSAEIASLFRQKGFKFPVYTGGDAFARAFRVRGVPYTVIVDRAGQIIRVIPGYIELEQMDKLIQGLTDAGDSRY